MGGGGHGHHPMPKVPDYKIYKVEDIPELMRVKRALAAQGLKDPWLRNEVWKYDRRIRGTLYENLRRTLGRGMVIGFGLAVVTTAVGKIWDATHPDEHGHGEGGHH